MIAKYPAACRYCKRSIEVGRDIYEIETKTSYHIECHENQPPTAEQFATADRLRFIRPGEPIPADWFLPFLSGEDRSDPAGEERTAGTPRTRFPMGNARRQGESA